MADSLKVSFTIVYEPVEDDWVMARVLEVPGAISQGRTRSEARANVRDALREVLASGAGEIDSASADAADHCVEPLELRIAP